VGHITRTELLKYLNQTESHNGFANRLLFTCVKRSKYLPEGGNLPEQQLQRLASRIAAAVDWVQNMETPRLFQRDEEARELWRHVYPELSNGLPGLLSAATSRAESQVLRLSAIYAALDQSGTVRVEHLRAALAVWDYCFHSAKLIFGEALGDPVADRIREALEAAGKDGMTRTEIRDLFKRNCTAARIEQALRLLLALGIANKRDIDTGGKPIEQWNLTT
jgi:hypothetical protein